MAIHEVQMEMNGEKAYPKIIIETIMIGRSGDFTQNVQANWVSQIMPLNETLNVVGTGLTREGNNVRIGKGITKVLVSGTLNLNGVGQGNNYGAVLFINNVSQGFINEVGDIAGGGMINVFLSPIMLSVTEGMLIGLGMRCNNGYTGSYRGGRSNFVVQVLA